MDCKSAQEQFSAYLLGALEAGEIEELDLHVDWCDTCCEVLRVEGEIVVDMAHLPPQIAAPDRVKRRLISAVEADRFEGGLLAGLRTRFLLGPRLRLSGHTGIVLASIAIVVMALGGVWANGRLNEIAEAKDAMARQAEVLSSPRSVLEDRLLITYTQPAAELVVEELSATSGSSATRGMFLVPKTENTALLVGLGLARLPRNFEYRVWLILEGRQYEGGSFGVDAAGFGYTTIEFFAPLSQLDGIGVTIERRRGDDDPAGAVVWDVLLGDL
jgi:hypothetical protein